VDRVLVRGLELYCIIGLQSWEREVLQKVRIDLDLETDCRPAGTSDDVTRAVDYRAVSKAVQALVETSHFKLVEALAESIAALLLSQFAVAAVTIQVTKPGAVRFAKTVGVEIRRERRESP